MKGFKAGRGAGMRAALGALVAIAITGGTISAASAAPQTVKDNALSVGSDMTYPPFAFLKDGKPGGFDIELMEGIAKRMKLDSNFVDTRFASLITGLRAGHFDVVASALYVTPERQKVVNFIPYLKAGSSLLVLKGAAYRPAAETELCGKVIGSMQGASWLPKLKTLSDEHCIKHGLGAIETREFDTDAQVTQALRSKSVDVEFMDNVVAAELLKKFPNDYEVTSTSLIYPITIGIAVAPQNDELYAGVAAAFRDMVRDGSYEQLVKSYGMEGLSSSEIDAAISQAQ